MFNILNYGLCLAKLLKILNIKALHIHNLVPFRKYSQFTRIK